MADAAGAYVAPDGTLVDADRERELVRLALNDAWGFAYHAPTEREWWAVFWESLERHADDRVATGQAALEDYVPAATPGGRND